MHSRRDELRVPVLGGPSGKGDTRGYEDSRIIGELRQSVLAVVDGTVQSLKLCAVRYYISKGCC